MTDPIRQKRLNERKNYINLKRSVPCHDCGGTFPICCMDFHHIEEDTKHPSIGRSSLISVMQKYSIEKIDKEIEKCVVICANCHRIRHHT